MFFSFSKSILNDDSFKEYINHVVFIDLKYVLIWESLFVSAVSVGCHEHIYWKQSLRGVPWNQLKLENIEILYL